MAMLPKYTLLEAVRFNCMTDFEEAIAGGKPLTEKDLQQRGAVEIAFRYHSTDALLRLIQLGAAQNPAVGKGGNFLIHAAARAGEHDTLTTLIEAGVDLNKSGASGHTALHILCEKRYEYLAGIFLDHNASPHARTNQNNTPLHIAAKEGSTALVCCLLDAADPLAENQTGYTSVNEAAAAGRVQVIQIFLQASIGPPRTDTLWNRIARAAALTSQHAVVSTIQEKIASSSEPSL